MKQHGNRLRRLAIQRFWSDNQGQDLIEYALAAGLVAVAAVAAMPVLTTTIDHVFSRIATIVQSAVS